MNMLDMTIIRLAAGLVLLIAANIALGSINAIIDGEWDQTKFRNGCIKSAVVAAALVAVYFAGYLNPDLMVVEVDGQTVNLMTAVSLAMLAAFTAYAVDVLKKLKDMLSTATPGADAAPTALPSGEGKEDHTAPEEECPMSNSPLVSYTKLSPNHSGQRTRKIDRITPHCVVGQCSVERLGDIFLPASREASCNYGIGADGRVGMYVEEKNRSWCSSSNANDQRAVTIECASDGAEPYAFRDVVYQSLITLCVDICKRNGKTKLLWLEDKDKTLAYTPAPDEMVLTVHRWFANKSCPGNWMYARMGDLAEKVTAQLSTGTDEEDDDMDINKFKELWREMRKELQDNDASAYSEEARKWAVDNGIIRGGNSDEFNGMWEDMMTREQLVTVLYRFAQKFGLS